MGALVGLARDDGPAHRAAAPGAAARGPVEHRVAWLIAVHGVHASFGANIGADPRVRLKMNGRWHAGTASLAPLDHAALRRFNLYARMGPRVVGIEPKLVRVELAGQAEGPSR
jgi:F420H(2)-dependent quinone reductase